MLKLADTLRLPLEAVTSTFAIVGLRGAGKTNTAVVLAEELLKAHQRVLILDPVGVWWGLRSTRDGEAAGLPVNVIGGRHGDVPIEPGAGAVIADLVIDEPVSCVLDVRDFSNREKARFITDLFGRLYRRNSEPLHIILDEADQFAPQQPLRGEEEMLGAVLRIVKQGRAQGIGLTAITQRPATLSKSVLTQCETLIAMRLIGPQDIRAIDEWVKAWGTAEQRAEFLELLPRFKRGQGLVWSPAAFELYAITQFRERETFDSSYTPKPGQRRIEPKVLAAVDLEMLRARMAETIERARHDDPRALRAEIERLRRELKTAAAAAPAAEVQTLRASLREAREGVDAWYARFEKLGQGVQGFIAAVRELCDRLEREHLREVMPAGMADKLRARGGAAEARLAHNQEAAGSNPAPAPNRTIAHQSGASNGTGGAAELDAGDRRILSVLARYERKSRTDLALLSQYSPRGGAYQSKLKGLVDRQLVISVGNDYVITGPGRAALGPIDELPSGRDLVEWWVSRLPEGQARIYYALVDAHPKGMLRANLAEASGYTERGGAFQSALRHLRVLELIEERGREWFAVPIWEARAASATV